MIRALHLLDLRHLARHPLRSLLAVLAVAAGSSLSLSVIAVSTSVNASLETFGHQLAGVAPLRVVGATSSAGIEGSVLAAVRRVPGVAHAVPVVQAASVVHLAGHAGGPPATRDVAVLGVDCDAALLVGTPRCASSSLPPNLLLTSPALARRVGAARGSWLETDTGVLGVRSAIPMRALGGVAGGNVIVMPLAEAQRRFDRAGRLDAIYTTLGRGVALSALERRIRTAVGPQNGVLTASQPPPEISFATATILPLLTLLALLASGIAAVLVYNVVNLTLEDRRRSYAIVAAIGAPRPVLVAGPLIEACLLGATGGFAGTGLGLLLARSVATSLGRFAAGFFGVPITITAGAPIVAIGLLLGTGIAALAALAPARRQLRLDVASELAGRDQREKASLRRPVRNGAIFAALGGAGLAGSWAGQRAGALAGWQPPVAVASFLVVAVCTILAVGAWSPVVIRLVSRLARARRADARRAGARRAGSIDHLALVNLLREPGRTGIVAVAVSATVVTAFLTGSYARAIHSAIASGLRHGAAGHALEVSTLGDHESFNTDTRIPARDARALAALGGVASAHPFDAVLAGHTRRSLLEVEAATRLPAGTAVFAGSAGAGAFRRGDVLVGAGAARNLGLHPGSILPLDTPRGLAPVRVEGVWDNGDAGGMNVTMAARTFRRLYGGQLPLAMYLVTAPGVAPSTVAREARRAHLSPALVFSTPTQRLAADSAAASAQLEPFWALQHALLMVAFVTVLATLLLAGMQRRRELGLLAAVGATPSGLFRMVLIEAGGVGAVGALAGIAAGLIMLASLVWVTPLFAGYRGPYTPDPASLTLYVPLALVVALAAALWPAWRAARLSVIEALRYE